MQILGHLCLLLVLCTVIDFYRKMLGHVLGFFLMDSVKCLRHLNLKASFGFGFLLFGSFEYAFKILGLFFLFGIGLRFLQISWYYKGFCRFLCDYRGKSDGLRNGICSKSDLDVKYSSEIASCQCKLLKSSNNLSTSIIDKLVERKDNDPNLKGEGGDDNAHCGVKSISGAELNGPNDDDDEEEEEEEEQECYEEDEEFDVLTLRKLIKIERQKANNARLELEKERMAAATAAEEAMAMILRLQNEKSLVELEANQYRRLAEEKQLHDQEVIQSLEWLLLEHESESSLLEDQLRLCGQKMKLTMQSDEGDHSGEVEVPLSSSNASFENAFLEVRLRLCRQKFKLSMQSDEGDHSQGVEMQNDNRGTLDDHHLYLLSCNTTFPGTAPIGGW